MVIDVLNLKTPVPCIQGFFTDRVVTYSTQVSPKQIMNLLGHDPRSKNWKRLPDELRQIYEYLQRRTSKDRREGVAAYIEDRFGEAPISIGAFPAISIAIQQPAEFKPYPTLPKAVGELMIDIAPSNFRVLIDGLSRVTGALELIEEGNQTPLEHFHFPVTIYAPTQESRRPFSWQEMGQLFHDFNFRVQPVAKQHAVALDTSDIYISLANHLAKCPVFEDHGGVLERAASLGGKSSEIIVQTMLVRTVRGACEGRKFQESNLATVEEPNLTRETFRPILTSLDDFFSSFAKLLGEEKFKDRQSLHLSSPGWQALGVLHHDLEFKLKLGPAERAKVLNKIAAIDWSRYNPDWLKLGIGHPEMDKKTMEPIVDASGRQKVALTGAGRTNTQKLLDYMREKAEINELLTDYYEQELAA